LKKDPTRIDQVSECLKYSSKHYQSCTITHITSKSKQK